MKNFFFPRSDEVVSQPERKEKKKTDVGSKATFPVSLLWPLLQQVTDGGYMLDTVTEECSSILQTLGPTDSEYGENHLKINYTSKQLKDLHSKYQAVALEASAFMVTQGKWDTYTESVIHPQG